MGCETEHFEAFKTQPLLPVKPSAILPRISEDGVIVSFLFFPFPFSFSRAFTFHPFVKIRVAEFDETIITDNETADVLSNEEVNCILTRVLQTRETGLATSSRKIRKGSQNPRFSEYFTPHLHHFLEEISA